MIRRLANWFDDRTGVREILHEALYERIPGGARWRYVWGSTLVFCFAVQVLTGFCMWTVYSPSVQHAWESVFYIQHHMFLGGLIRGMHHNAAHVMVILMAIHLMQVIIDGAYRAPREINFWLGLILLQIVMALALTGYLLPWDQKGYYATQVATKIMGATPVVGNQLQLFVQGGPQYGHHTLTRFFALHAGLLPAGLVLFLSLHIYVFRRHGIKPADPDRRSTGVFWPDQVLMDAVACLGVLAVLLLLAIFGGQELSPPADASESFAAARPEAYFLFLFRFLKFEAVEHFGLAFGAIYVPGLVMAIIAAMPIIGWWKSGHRFNVAFMWVLATCIGLLTALAVWEDATDVDHQASLAEAHRDAERVVELASRPTRIPVTGAVTLLREDPFTQGPRIFAKHCAGCHFYDGHNGRGRVVMDMDRDSGEMSPAKPTAPDLGQLGRRAWMRAMLVDFENHYASLRNAAWFGEADGIDPANSEMTDWSGDLEGLRSEENAANLNAVVEYMVSLSGRQDLQLDQSLIARGEEIAVGGEWAGDISASCLDCHTTMEEPFAVTGESDGYPDIAEYLSRKWLVAFISDPGSEQFYGSRNHMPPYADKLSSVEMDLLVRWLTGDYFPTEVAPYQSAAPADSAGAASDSSD